jgi:teichuronic acid biosynthesis glycosyltransferase TuaC
LSVKLLRIFFTEAYKQKIKKYANANIHIYDAVYGIEKFRKYFEADCFVFPSHNEGQSLVLLEALAMKVPIVTTKIGFIPEMLENANPIYFEAQNQESLLDALGKFRVDYTHNIEPVQYFT